MNDLRALEWSDLTALFGCLLAPASDVMDGEFDSGLPAYAEDEWRSAMRDLGRGYWLGKAYSPDGYDGHDGQGYNCYRAGDVGIERLSRFVWDITDSTISDGTSLVMHYAAFDNWGGSHDLIDEVRIVQPGLYLGAYHTAAPVPGFTPHPGTNGRSRVEYFFLEGPRRTFGTPDGL